MTPETWTVMVVAAAFLLLGIAISPLGWIALRHQRFRFEQQLTLRLQEAVDQLRSLEDRLGQMDNAGTGRQIGTGEGAGNKKSHQPHWPGAAERRRKRAEVSHADSAYAPTLIAVPSLAAPASEREASAGQMSLRYSAIWSLADSGASADVIARATGQPIGQIELILGLRRRIDANGTKIPHGPHI
jgi:hypothetical protein